MQNAQRLYERRIGVFNHFLYDAPSAQTALTDDFRDWNRRVEAFDVNDLARTLHQIGVGYYFITVMQGRKFMLAPNAVYDEIAGTKPGQACAQRDLIMDLGRALQAYDIDLYLYYTGDGPHLDKEIGSKFGFIEPRKNVSQAFVRRWASVLQEYSTRYGDMVKGWWVDGCYDQFGYNDALLQLYYDAIHAGSPNAAAAFNNGVKPTLEKWFCDEDFTAGEFNDFTYVPQSRFIDGAQAHILAPLGVSPDGSPWGGWRRRGTKCSHAQLEEYVGKLRQVGCALTVDIFIDETGRLDEEQLRVIDHL